MKETVTLRVIPRIAATPSLLVREVAKQLRIDEKRVVKADIVRRSIDARQRQVMVGLTVDAHIDKVEETPILRKEYQPVPLNAPQAIVVGAGPAGLFAALTLIERGIRPIVIERGKDVDSRRKDLAAIARMDTVDPDSNYAFGEGGAGAYSDGKLYTRSKKRGSVESILRVFHDHGAPDSILVDAHPHIGTDLLPGVIKAIRETIIAAGGRVLFETRVSDLIFDKDGAVTGVETARGQRFEGPVILATGHSARDVYRMLN
ncbi:MAG: FAD-binding protein, partial [Muribaculaceae bacterium]|nr:FAD-binding protein [Muribaculaceae bacterium]